MNESQQEQYKRIASAIRFLLSDGARKAPLADVAAVAHYSPFHFQKLFSEYTGISPKKFQQYLNIRHATALLSADKPLDELSREAGLSGISRLHALFVSIEAMTPDEFRRGGASLSIAYSFQESPFGSVLVASTKKGICHLAFYNDNRDSALAALKARFPAADYREEVREIHLQAIAPLCQRSIPQGSLHLHIKGSPFQLKIWEALLHIPSGCIVGYHHVARHSGEPKASRAAGTAIGANPVAYLIPCHRVIRSSGLLGGYRWGLETKEALLAWEIAREDTELTLDDESVVG